MALVNEMLYLSPGRRYRARNDIRVPEINLSQVAADATETWISRLGPFYATLAGALGCDQRSPLSAASPVSITGS